MTEKVYDRKYYRYKIIDDVPNMGDNCSVEKITLHKSKWSLSENYIYELTSYIRTPNNRKGIVQLQEFNPSNEFVYYDSIKYVTENVKLPIYTRDQLGLMDRDELVEICRYLGIDYIHKPDKYLVKFIVDKQKELKLESVEEDKLSNKLTTEFKKSEEKLVGNKKKKS